MQYYFQALVGAQSDLPPGAALCKVAEKATAEERAVIQKQWVLCMDQEGHICPQLIFPWFANGKQVQSAYSLYPIHLYSMYSIC